MASRRLSPATKNKIRLAQSGKQNSMYGKHHRKAVIAKLSDLVKGKKNTMYGKHHSAEARKKMSLAAKKRHLGK